MRSTVERACGSRCAIRISKLAINRSVSSTTPAAATAIAAVRCIAGKRHRKPGQHAHKPRRSPPCRSGAASGYRWQSRRGTASRPARHGRPPERPQREGDRREHAIEQSQRQARPHARPARSAKAAQRQIPGDRERQGRPDGEPRQCPNAGEPDHLREVDRKHIGTGCADRFHGRDDGPLAVEMGLSPHWLPPRHRPATRSIPPRSDIG